MDNILGWFAKFVHHQPTTCFRMLTIVTLVEGLVVAHGWRAVLL